MPIFKRDWSIHRDDKIKFVYSLEGEKKKKEFKNENSHSLT